MFPLGAEEAGFGPDELGAALEQEAIGRKVKQEPTWPQVSELEDVVEIDPEDLPDLVNNEESSEETDSSSSSSSRVDESQQEISPAPLLPSAAT